MPFLKTVKISVAVIAVALLAAACGKVAEVTKPESAKSLAYYTENARESEQMVQKCKTMENNELSTMSPSQIKTWLETTAGINCKNAMQATAIAINNAYQKKMRDAADKYVIAPATKK